MERARILSDRQFARPDRLFPAKAIILFYVGGLYVGEIV